MTSTLDRTARVFRSPGSYAAAAGTMGIVYVMYWTLALVVLIPWWGILISYFALKYMLIAYWWLAVQTWKWSKFLWRACVNGYAYMVR